MSGASAPAPWDLERVLADLRRWQFGALLAERARWSAPDPLAVDQAVQAFRLRILAACLVHAGRDESLPLRLPAGDAGSWETPLVEDFLDGLKGLAPFGEAEAALTRFAHGQYFKYSRRVASLMALEAKLPCAYAPK